MRRRPVMIGLVRIDGLWEAWAGRLTISQRLFCCARAWVEITEAPGFWYVDFGYWRISWRRKWIVWGDHPCRGDNIRHYDQFGTWGDA